MGSDSFERNLESIWKNAGGALPDSWRIVALGELLEFDKSISVGVMYPGKHDPSGTPLVKVGDVSNGLVDETPKFWITKSVDEEYKRTKLNGSELIMTLVGNPGDCIVVSDVMVGWNVARALAVIRLKDVELREWIKLVLLSIPSKHIIDSRLNTTVQKTLNLKDVKQLPIPLPPENLRISVCEIAQIYQQKIQLNRKTNQTLEQMAQALFKSWFIDFDPVLDNALAAGNPIPEPLQTKAERRQQVQQQADFSPLPADIRALFPCEFEQTDEPSVGIAGWVPKGWECSALGNKVTVKRGGSPRPIKDYIVNEGFPWTKISDATSSESRFITITKEYIKPEGLSKTTLLKKGCLILSNSATPGLPMFLDLDACIHDGWLHFPEKEGFSDLYLYELFIVSRAHLVQQGNGSVFTNLKTDILKEYKVVVPPSNILKLFDSKLSPIHQRLNALSEETASLKKIRETLLPKLISGEISLDQVTVE